MKIGYSHCKTFLFLFFLGSLTLCRQHLDVWCSTVCDSEFVEFSVAGQGGPVRKAVNVSGLVQRSVSVCQSQLVAQANLTLKDKQLHLRGKLMKCANEVQD